MSAGRGVDALVGRAASVLTRAGIGPTARLEAEDLLSWALRREGERVSLSQVRVWEVLGTKLPASRGVQTALPVFEKAVARRVRREPLQWIEGEAPFRGLELCVGPGVFIPRPETELVTGEAVTLLRQRAESAREEAERPPVAADLFAGSGAIGFSLASEVPGLRVVAVEKSHRAFTYLRENASILTRRHTLPEGSYQPLLANVFTSAGLLRGAARRLGGGLFDAIVANPPYLPAASVRQPEATFDPPDALYGGGRTGLRTPLHTIFFSRKILRPGGLLIMEHDPRQDGPLEVELRRSGFDRVREHRDLSGRSRWVVARLAPRRTQHERGRHGGEEENV